MSGDGNFPGYFSAEKKKPTVTDRIDRSCCLQLFCIAGINVLLFGGFILFLSHFPTLEEMERWGGGVVAIVSVIILVGRGVWLRRHKRKIDAIRKKLRSTETSNHN